MKKLPTLFFLIVFVSSIVAQEEKGIYGKSNWLNYWTNFKPKSTEYPAPNIILNGVIDKDMVLQNKNTYIIYNVVYVTNNATLTIEPGTVIRGDFETCGTLVVTKGSKIIAKGTETDPIVFTSNKGEEERKPGDWGGIIILGDAPINRFGGVSFLDFNLDPKYNFYGGNNEKDNSGILNFVRIEFAGRKLNAKKELNGLSLAGVGSATQIDFLQVSFSNDDSLESYGGNLSLQHLVSYRATDDDFDFTQGVQATITNALALRFPFSSDISRSRALEIDSSDKIETMDIQKKKTTILASNLTLVNCGDNNQGLCKEAVDVKKDSYFSIQNSVVSGFESFLQVEDKKVENVKWNSLSIHNCPKFIVSEKDNIIEEIANVATPTVTFTNILPEEFFVNKDFKKHPDFRLKENTLSTISMTK